MRLEGNHPVFIHIVKGDNALEEEVPTTIETFIQNK